MTSGVVTTDGAADLNIADPVRADEVASGPVKNGLLYAVSIALSRGATILLIPALTRQLTDRELGIYAVVSAVLLLLQYLSSLGLDAAATRWFYQFRDQANRDSTVSTWMVSQVLTSCVIAIVFALVAGPVGSLAFGGASPVRTIRTAALSLPFTVVTLIVQHWFRIRQLPIPAVLFSIATAVFTVGCTIAFLGPMELGLPGVFLGQAVAGAALTIIGGAIVFRKVHLRAFSAHRLKEMLRYALPVLPSVAAIYLLAVVTRLLINGLASTEVVGDYQVIAMLATGAALFTQAVQQAWEPYALANSQNETSRTIFRTALLMYVILAAVLCSAIAVVGPWALQLAGTRFGEFGPELVIICASILVSGSMPIINTGAAIVGSGRPALVVMGVSILANIAFAIVFVPRFELMGAMLASLFAAVVTVPIHVWLVEALWPVRVQPGRLFAVSIFAAVGVATVTVLSATELIAFVRSIAAAAVVAGCGVAVLFRLSGDLRRLPAATTT
jgi:O-antigen/teichoic acid export membrane protein